MHPTRRCSVRRTRCAVRRTLTLAARNIMTSDAKKNVSATIALVLSLCGLLAQPILGLLTILFISATKAHRSGDFLLHSIFILPPLLGLVSVILGHSARGKIKRDPSLSGKATATTGMIIGYATIAYNASTWLLSFVGSYMLRDL